MDLILDNIKLILQDCVTNCKIDLKLMKLINNCSYN